MSSKPQAVRLKPSCCSELWLAVLLVTALSLSGCGPSRVPTYPVAGTIKFADGKPVRSGTIEFRSADFGTTATGTIRDDGTFTVGTYASDDGAAAGKQDVIVIQLIVGDGTAQLRHRDHGRAVPTRYGDYDTSALTAQIEPVEQNRITLTLESP